jgi:hypothetical protein
MTRRSITAVLASLLIGLLFVIQAPAASACELDATGNCVQSTSGSALHTVSFASVGPAITVPGADYRFLEVNTTMLPGAISASIGPSVVTAEDASVLTSQQQLFLAVNATMMPMQTPRPSCMTIPAPCAVSFG